VEKREEKEKGGRKGTGGLKRERKNRDWLESIRYGKKTNEREGKSSLSGALKRGLTQPEDRTNETRRRRRENLRKTGINQKEERLILGGAQDDRREKRGAPIMDWTLLQKARKRGKNNEKKMV